MVFELHALGRVSAAFGSTGIAPASGSAVTSPNFSAATARPLPEVDGLVRSDGLIDYRACLVLQETLRDEVVAGTRGPTLLIIEHPPVYTAGTSADENEYPYDGTEVVKIDRGGKVTWHGPGQLVAYLIGRLATPIDAAALVRDLEAALVETLAGFGVTAAAMDGRPGVWCAADARGPARKIAAIGLSIRRGVTMHGVAMNCANDLRPFGTIIPCGITDAGVTSIESEGVSGVMPAIAGPILAERLQHHVAHRYAAAGVPASPDASGTDALASPDASRSPQEVAA